MTEPTEIPEIPEIAADEARRLQQEEGWTIVDVRSIEEFAAGHPGGSWNIPWAHQGPAGLVPNPEFEEVLTRRFQKGDKLILSCRSGRRSMNAALQLQALGYSELRNLAGGMVGHRDHNGELVQPGWNSLIGEVEQGEPEGRNYTDLR